MLTVTLNSTCSSIPLLPNLSRSARQSVVHCSFSLHVTPVCVVLQEIRVHGRRCWGLQ